MSLAAIALIFSIIALGGVVYLIFLAPDLRAAKDGRRMVEIRETEQNVTVKVKNDKQYLVGEDGKILDRRRIANLK